MKWFGRKTKTEDELTEEIFGSLPGKNGDGYGEVEEAVREACERASDKAAQEFEKMTEETIREACERAADEAARALEGLDEETEGAEETEEAPETVVGMEDVPPEAAKTAERKKETKSARKFGVIAGIGAAVLAVSGAAVLLLRKKK